MFGFFLCSLGLDEMILGSRTRQVIKTLILLLIFSLGISCENRTPDETSWAERVPKKLLKKFPEAFAYVKEDPRLPRILLVGDSISIGYTPWVSHLLAGKANVHRIPDNGYETINGIQKLNGWLGQKNWDIILFNWGGHDYKRVKDGVYDIQGETVTSLKEYKKNLEVLVERLKRTGAQLIWANSTPIPLGAPGRIEGDEIKFNKVAEKVMDLYSIPIIDLHGFASIRLKGFQLPQDVHFSEKGYKVLAEEVAKKLKKYLDNKSNFGDKKNIS